MVTRSLANLFGLKARRWPPSIGGRRYLATGLAVNPAQLCSDSNVPLPLFSVTPMFLLCFLHLYVNSCTYFVFRSMWAGKVIKGRYLFTFPLSSLVWFGTGAKGCVLLWLELGHRCCRSLAILWGLELSTEWYCRVQCVPGIPLPWREFCHYFALLVGWCFASGTACVD